MLFCPIPRPEEHQLNRDLKGREFLPKRYWFILLTYVLCQFSFIIPALTPILKAVPKDQRQGTWLIISFSLALIIVLLLLIPERRLQFRNRLPASTSALWALGGIVLLFVVQAIAAAIESSLFAENPHSQNTEQIVDLTKLSPYLILVVGIAGPILEEIVFRKIIFGSLYRKIGFWAAGIISSLLFAFAHMDKHILLYGLIGLTLCYLYKKTGRIIVSMFAHASMNTIVILLSLMTSSPKALGDTFWTALTVIGR